MIALKRVQRPPFASASVLDNILSRRFCSFSSTVFDVQVKHILAQPVSSRPALGAQEASMLVWALAVLHELTPSIWTALLDAIAAAPSESLDEVHQLHHLCCIA